MDAGRWVGWVVLAALSGCTGSEPEDKGVPDGEGDADTDTDTDTDTDADADTDGDTDGDSLSGTIVHTRTEDGADVCNEALDMSGTPYAGYCPGCLFAFDIATTPNGAIGDCGPIEASSPIFDWTDYGGFIGEIKLGFAEQYEMVEYVGSTGPAGTYTLTTSSTTVYDAVLFGFRYGLTKDDPIVFFLLGYADGYPADVAWDGAGHLEFAVDLAYDYAMYTPYVASCDAAYSGASLPTLAAGGTNAEDIVCDGSALDVWAFDAVAGQVLEVAVDNGAPVDPYDVSDVDFRITDAANCIVAYEGGTLPCSNQPPLGPPPPYTGYTYTATTYCGTLQDTIASTGTYHVVVDAHGLFGCAEGDVTPYVLTGNLDGAPIVFTRVADDAPYDLGIVAVEEQSTVDVHVSWTPSTPP